MQSIAKNIFVKEAELIWETAEIHTAVNDAISSPIRTKYMTVGTLPRRNSNAFFSFVYWTNAEETVAMLESDIETEIGAETTIK